MVGLAGCCWWSSRGQDSAAQEFSKLNFRRQFSNRRREGKGRGKAQSGQRKLSLQQENLLSRSPSPSFALSPGNGIVVVDYKSPATMSPTSSSLSLSLFLSFSLPARRGRAAVRILFAPPAHFPAHSPLSSQVPSSVRYYMKWCRGTWMDTVVLVGYNILKIRNLFGDDTSGPTTAHMLNISTSPSI